MTGLYRTFLVLFILMMTLPSGGNAANVCSNHIARIERIEGIPRNLLAAMARVESGRMNQDSGAVEPWPWTLQAEGKSYYFETRSEAARQIQTLMKRGVKNIDVGCMQINIGHHGHNFPSVDHMLDPAKNVRYAAQFLKDLKSKEGTTWSTAVGNYHSTTDEHHKRYKELVFKSIPKVSKEQSQSGPRIIRMPGGLYPIRETKPTQYASASLQPYQRTYGMNRVNRSSGPRLIKMPPTQTSRKKAAIMRSRGVKDTQFMNPQG